MKIIAYFITTFVLTMILLVPATRSVFAAENVLNQACSGSGSAANSALCKDKDKPSTTILGPQGILVKAVQIVITIVGIASVVMVVIGGFKYVLSNGDAGQIASAKSTILYALIGMVIAGLSSAIISFVISKV